MKFYTDSQGRIQEIEKMVNAHLLNAYVKHRKQLKELREAVDAQYIQLDETVKAELVKQNQTVDSLFAEIKKRDLL